MEELIELFKEKNHFLKKFYLLNLKELENFRNNKFENLEFFYSQREKLIDIIGYIKAKIEKLGTHQELKSHQLCPAIKAIEENNNLITKDIFEQDSEILAHIENAKNTIIKELQKIKTGKKIVAKYKGFSHQTNLDEEA
jgi:DNA integrity scanning protein DisA with diadenylate cyclase activity